MSHATADTVSWWERTKGEDDFLVAYFSMEFGLHERLPIYSGGLGVLAGDHLKAAAELGVPLVGVGLLYRGGYFRQEIDADGRQTEDYQRVDPNAVGLVREPVTVTVELADETIEAAVWRKDVGSVPLYLLEVEWLTDALYSGDREHRIRQELLLGVGGVRALTALGIEPTVFHLNEGHSAFLQIERCASSRRRACRRRLRSSTCAARRSSPRTRPSRPGTRSSTKSSSSATWASSRRRPASTTRRCSSSAASGDKPGFGMTPFALRLSAYANGVSDLHGEVAREMWASLWPGQETPIGHVTNGVHIGTLARSRARRAAAVRGRRARKRPRRGELECGAERRPEEIWRVHAAAKARLAERAGIDRDRLTIGFARRFATYKRAGLVFSDIERLLALPVQIVVAGKAHPADDARQGRDAGDHRARRGSRAPRVASSSSRTTTWASRGRWCAAATSG